MSSLRKSIARTKRAHVPATAHPTRCASQLTLPELQKCDWSTAWVLSDGQCISVMRGRGRGKKNCQWDAEVNGIMGLQLQTGVRAALIRLKGEVESPLGNTITSLYSPSDIAVALCTACHTGHVYLSQLGRHRSLLPTVTTALYTVQHIPLPTVTSSGSERPSLSSSLSFLAWGHLALLALWVREGSSVAWNPAPCA